MPPAPVRIAVVGHVEHVTLAALAALPGPGEISHLDDFVTIPGGGGGNAFFQLARSPAELHLFTALGNDDAASYVAQRVEATGAAVHAARRDQPHTRDLALVTPDGERTIFVIGEPLHPRRDDPLPWGALSTFRAAYFTAQDPEALAACRAAQLLIVTARRKQALERSGVQADVVVGSVLDRREASALADYAVAPDALVMTEGPRGGYIETPAGTVRFPPGERPPGASGGYGAGDSFAGALVWYLAAGLDIEAACARASAHGTAVLRGLDPLAHQLPLETP